MSSPTDKQAEELRIPRRRLKPNFMLLFGISVLIPSVIAETSATAPAPIEEAADDDQGRLRKLFTLLSEPVNELSEASLSDERVRISEILKIPPGKAESETGVLIKEVGAIASRCDSLLKEIARQIERAKISEVVEGMAALVKSEELKAEYRIARLELHDKGAALSKSIFTWAPKLKAAGYFDFEYIFKGNTLQVGKIEPNSKAAKAGLRSGDLITIINGAPPTITGSNLTALVGKHDGEVVELTLLRDGRTIPLQVELDNPERRSTHSLFSSFRTSLNGSYPADLLTLKNQTGQQLNHCYIITGCGKGNNAVSHLHYMEKFAVNQKIELYYNHRAQNFDVSLSKEDTEEIGVLIASDEGIEIDQANYSQADRKTVIDELFKTAVFSIDYVNRRVRNPEGVYITLSGIETIKPAEISLILRNNHPKAVKFDGDEWHAKQLKRFKHPDFNPRQLSDVTLELTFPFTDYRVQKSLLPVP